MNKKHLINIIIILALGIIVYANSFSGDFIWDANILIKANIYIKSFSFANLKHIATGAFFDNSSKFNYYRPLPMLLFMFDYSIWKLNPFGYHLTNFILHFVNACLIYTLLFYFYKRRTLALFLSLIFIIHPNTTEAITYIASRSDPLALIFLLISFLFIHFWRLNLSKKSFYIYSVISFSLACLSKETALTFPAFLFIYLLTSSEKNGGKFKKAILVLIPYFLVSIIYLFTRYEVLKTSGNSFLSAPFVDSTIRIINAPLILVRYIIMFLFPRPFVFLEPLTLYAHPLHPVIIITTALIATILFLCVKFYKSKATLGTIWFFTFIFPVSGIVPIMAYLYYHWLYIPSLGLLIIAAEAITKVPRIFKRFLLSIGVIIILFYSVLTIKQNLYFNDEIKFYQETLKKDPKHPNIHHNLAIAYLEKGHIDKAITELKKTIELKPDHESAYINLGYAYQKKNLIPEAEKTFYKAIAMAPRSYLPYYHLANLYTDTGRAYRGIVFYKKSISLKPNDPDIYFDIGRAYDHSTQTEEAIKSYQKTIELNPSYAAAYTNLGAIFAQKGRLDEAKVMWEKGLQYEPNNILLRQNLTQLKKLRE